MTYWFNIKYILFVLTLSATTLFAQRSGIVADLGFDKITAEEFKFRFELSPYLQTSRDIDSLKNEFLYTLIAEKLWADEAIKNGLAQDEYVVNSTKIMEKYCVRDELYRIEVLEKADVSERDLFGAMELAKRTFEMKFLHSDTETDINDLYQKLQNGADFDSLLQQRTESAEQNKPIYVKFGQMKRDLEEVIFNLTPGHFSKPVPTEKGWMIFWVKNIIRSSDTEKAKELASKTLENRRVVELQNVFYRHYIKGSVINADKNLFKKLFDKIDHQVKQKPKSKDSKSIHLGFYDFQKIKNSFSQNDRNTNFVKVGEEKITLEYFLDDLAFNEMDFTDTVALNTASRLNGYLRNFIQSEIIAAVGYRRGLQHSRKVVNNVGIWRQHFLAALYKNSFIKQAKQIDFISDSTLIPGNYASRTKYRIREVICETLEETQSVLSRIEKGEEFSNIAAEHNGIEGGLSEWFGGSGKGEIGAAASAMQIGEIFGPAKVQRGYLIFQLAGKKDNDSAPEDFAAFLDSLSEQQKFNVKLRSLITKKTVHLAESTKLKIDYGLLKELEVNTLPIFVYRYFGFGGRTSAVPYLSPFHEWFKKFKKESLNP